MLFARYRQLPQGLSKTKLGNFLPRAAFLFSEDSENVENTCIEQDWEKIETSLTFFKFARLVFETNEDCNRNNRHWNFDKSASRD